MKVWLSVPLLVLAGLAGCSSCKRDEDAKARARGEALAKQETAKLMAKASQDRSTAPRIRLDDVIAEINADPTAASSKYDTQLVKIVGKVAEKDSVKIVIHEGNGAASCPLPAAELAKVAVGDAVVVTGVFQKGGGHIAVRLDVCELAAPDGG